MTTKEIGKMEGRLLCFGGPYSNLEALKAMRQTAEALEIGPEHVICTGDIVGYCAEPQESLDFVKEWGIHCILGNVEANLRDGLDDCGCNFSEGGRCDTLSQQWYSYARANVTPSGLAYIRTLPNQLTGEISGRRFRVLHGGIANISKFIFQATPWDVKLEEFKACEEEVVIAGHSGLPFVDSRDARVWFNPGVIGMPANNGQTNTWFGLVKSIGTKLSFTTHKLTYEANSAKAKMVNNALPMAYANSLTSGYWDNCEILPPGQLTLPITETLVIF